MKRKSSIFFKLLLSQLLLLFTILIPIYYSNNYRSELKNSNVGVVESEQTEVKEEVIKEVEKPIEKIIKEEKQWINIIASAYSASTDECGNNLGITASGTKVSVSRGTIATPRDIPFGTKINIPQLKRTFVVEDRGSSKYIRRVNADTIRIDIYMETKKEAMEFGVQKFKGYIIE